jgi:hypothetical protein
MVLKYNYTIVKFFKVSILFKKTLLLFRQVGKTYYVVTAITSQLYIYRVYLKQRVLILTSGRTRPTYETFRYNILQIRNSFRFFVKNLNRKIVFVLIASKATLPTSNARSETSASRSTRMNVKIAKNTGPLRH